MRRRKKRGNEEEIMEEELVSNIGKRWSSALPYHQKPWLDCLVVHCFLECFWLLNLVDVTSVISKYNGIVSSRDYFPRLLKIMRLVDNGVSFIQLACLIQIVCLASQNEGCAPNRVVNPQTNVISVVLSSLPVFQFRVRREVSWRVLFREGRKIPLSLSSPAPCWLERWPSSSCHDFSVTAHKINTHVPSPNFFAANRLKLVWERD